MNRRHYMIISIILVVIVILGFVVYYDYVSTRTKSTIEPLAGTPPTLYFSSVSPQNITASQGTTLLVNLTLTSYCSSEIAVPIKDFTINGYTGTTDYNYNGSSPWTTSVQETVFNYSFSFSQLILQPSESNSTFLTIQLANNATLGSYSLDINLGKIIFLSPPGKYDVSYSEITSLVMIVNPSANLVAGLGVSEVGNTSSITRSYNRLFIEGSVTNNGQGEALNAGLHVLAYAEDGTLEINMTVPLTCGEFGANAAIYSYIYSFDPYCTSSPKFGNLSGGQSADVNLDIYHEGTVANWTVTPVWTNVP